MTVSFLVHSISWYSESGWMIYNNLIIKIPSKQLGYCRNYIVKFARQGFGGYFIDEEKK